MASAATTISSTPGLTFAHPRTTTSSVACEHMQCGYFFPLRKKTTTLPIWQAYTFPNVVHMGPSWHFFPHCRSLTTPVECKGMLATSMQMCVLSHLLPTGPLGEERRRAGGQWVAGFSHLSSFFHRDPFCSYLCRTLVWVLIVALLPPHPLLVRMLSISPSHNLVPG